MLRRWCAKMTPLILYGVPVQCCTERPYTTVRSVRTAVYGVPVHHCTDTPYKICIFQITVNTSKTASRGELSRRLAEVNCVTTFSR